MQKIRECLERIESEFNTFALACEADLETLFDETVEIQEMIHGYQKKLNQFDCRIKALCSLIEDYKENEDQSSGVWNSLPPCGGSQGGSFSCKKLQERAAKESINYMQVAVRDLSPGERLLMSGHQLVQLAKIHMDASELPVEVTNHVTLDMWNDAVDKIKSEMDWSINKDVSSPS